MSKDELRARIGRRVTWNFFGMPKGSKDKTGQGKVVYITLLLHRPTYCSDEGELTTFGIDDGKRVIEVPSSCIAKFHKKRKA